MAQPTAYEPATSFDSFNPSSFPSLGRKLDIELEAVEETTDQIRTNLALIQRDDGALANAVVTRDALAAEIVMGVDTPASWVTATDYSVRDSVIVLGVWYWATEAHTSGVFATDLSAGYWEEIFDFTDFISELALSDSTPQAIAASAGSAGTSEFASRADHVHPYTAPSPFADEEFLALVGKVTATLSSGTTAMTAKRRYRISSTATGTLPTMAAGDYVVVEFTNGAGVTATVGRNSQTIDGVAENDTYVGTGTENPVVRYDYASAGAVTSRLLEVIP